MPFRFKSIRSRLVFWFIMIFSILLFFIFLVIYKQQEGFLKASAYSKLSAIRDLKANELNTWLDERILNVQSIATSFEIRDLEKIISNSVNSKDASLIKEKAAETLKLLTLNNPYLSEIYVINAKNGKIIISTDSSYIGVNKTDDIVFNEPATTGNPYVKNIYFSTVMHKLTMSFAAPFFSAKDNVKAIGVIVANTNLDNSIFELLTNMTGLGKTGETFIVNKDLYALSELRHQPNAPMTFKLDTLPPKLAIQGKTGIIETTDYRGEKILSAYTYIPKMGWGFIAKQDLSEVNLPIKKMLQHLSIIFFVSFALLSLIAIFLAEGFTRPLIRMSEATKKIQSGDFTARINIKRIDEIGNLSATFDNMAENLMSRFIIQKGAAVLTESLITLSKLQSFSRDFINSLTLITSSCIGVFYLRKENEDVFENIYSVGLNEDDIHRIDLKSAEGIIGKSVITGEISHLKNIPPDTVFSFKTIAGTMVPKEIICIPVRIKNKTLAVASIGNLNEYSSESIEIVKGIWPLLNAAFSNLLSNEAVIKLAKKLGDINIKLKTRSEELSVQSEELKAQSEELTSQKEELMRQNLLIASQYRQVEEASRMKNEFVSNMSHELRTPLNSIIGLSKVLSIQTEEKLSEEETGYLEIIERNGRNLLYLINDILDLAKIEAGKMEVVNNPVFIEEIIENIEDMLSPIAKEKGLEYRTEILPMFPKFQSDTGFIRKILQNLIGNAIKFTEKGSILIKARYDKENAYIDVTDTGIGIKANDIPKIFEEFRQVDGSSTRHFEGTGLGLAISKKAAELLHGTIAVKSDPGKGSTFTLILPLKYINGDYISRQKEREFVVEKKDKTILIVDDDPSILNQLAEIVFNEGFFPLSSLSGKKAIEIAATQKPSMIFLDLLLPDIDGIEVINVLKDSPLTKNIPITVISVSKQKDSAIAAGASGFLSKPVKNSDVSQEIRKNFKKAIEDSNGKNKIRILLVEDNEDAIIQMKSLLEKEGYLVDVAKGGQETFDYLENNKPDGVILDLMMPEIDGFTVLKSIRNMKEFSMLPVLILTAKDLSKDEINELKSNHIQQLIRKGDINKEDLLFKVGMLFYENPSKEAHEFKDKEQTNNENIRIPENKSNPGNRKTILIVEDNQDNLATMKAILKGSFEIIEAVNGEEGHKLAEASIPDLILLDIALPVMDGYNVLNALKNSEATKNIPVIAVTASAMKGDKETILAAGFDDYISKPLEPDEFFTKIKGRLGISDG